VADPLVPHGSSDWFVVVDHSILYPTDSSTPSSPSALGDELRRLVDSSCQLLRDAPTTPQPVRAYEPSMPIEIFAASCSKPKASSSGKHRRKRPQALPAANTIVASRSSATRRRDVFAGTIRNSDGLPRPPDASHTSTHPDGTPCTVHTFRQPDGTVLTETVGAYAPDQYTKTPPPASHHRTKPMPLWRPPDSDTLPDGSPARRLHFGTPDVSGRSKPYAPTGPSPHYSDPVSSMMASMRFDGSLGARQQPRQAVLEPTRLLALQQSRTLLRTDTPQLDQTDGRALSTFVPGTTIVPDNNPAAPPEHLKVAAPAPCHTGTADCRDACPAAGCCICQDSCPLAHQVEILSARIAVLESTVAATASNVPAASECATGTSQRFSVWGALCATDDDEIKDLPSLPEEEDDMLIAEVGMRGGATHLHGAALPDIAAFERLVLCASTAAQATTATQAGTLAGAQRAMHSRAHAPLHAHHAHAQQQPTALSNARSDTQRAHTRQRPAAQSRAHNDTQHAHARQQPASQSHACAAQHTSARAPESDARATQHTSAHAPQSDGRAAQHADARTSQSGACTPRNAGARPVCSTPATVASRVTSNAAVSSAAHEALGPPASTAVPLSAGALSPTERMHLDFNLRWQHHRPRGLQWPTYRSPPFWHWDYTFGCWTDDLTIEQLETLSSHHGVMSAATLLTAAARRHIGRARHARVLLDGSANYSDTASGLPTPATECLHHPAPTSADVASCAPTHSPASTCGSRGRADPMSPAHRIAPAFKFAHKRAGNGSDTNPHQHASPPSTIGSDVDATDMWCRYCKVHGHSRQSCPHADSRACFTCQLPGHKARDCPTSISSHNDSSDSGAETPTGTPHRPRAAPCKPPLARGLGLRGPRRARRSDTHAVHVNAVQTPTSFSQSRFPSAGEPGRCSCCGIADPASVYYHDRMFGTHHSARVNFYQKNVQALFVCGVCRQSCAAWQTIFNVAYPVHHTPAPPSQPCFVPADNNQDPHAGTAAHCQRAPTLTSSDPQHTLSAQALHVRTPTRQRAYDTGRVRQELGSNDVPPEQDAAYRAKHLDWRRWKDESDVLTPADLAHWRAQQQLQNVHIVPNRHPHADAHDAHVHSHSNSAADDQLPDHAAEHIDRCDVDHADGAMDAPASGIASDDEAAADDADDADAADYAGEAATHEEYDGGHACRQHSSDWLEYDAAVGDDHEW
jgi:outer membrane murein-binding lipoprotein Lpp